MGGRKCRGTQRRRDAESPLPAKARAANLAAVVSHLARDRKGPAIAYQLLAYPVTGADFTTGSYRANADGYLLTLAGMQWFWDTYCPNPAERANPLATPLNATNFAKLPPALIMTAEFDPLRDEGEAYAAKLKSAGVLVDYVRFDGLIHDFLAMSRRFSASKPAMDKAVAGFEQCLRPAEFELRVDADLGACRASKQCSASSGATFTPMVAGVSSELWRIDVGDKTYCIKRALPRLQRCGRVACAGATQRRRSPLVAFRRDRCTASGTRGRRRRRGSGHSDSELVRYRAVDELEAAVDGRTGAPGSGHRNGRAARGTASAQRRRNPSSRHAFDNMDLLSALRLDPFFIAAIRNNPEVEHRLREAVDHLKTTARR